MTYSADNSEYMFFVVGGNVDGTEPGRIYFYRSPTANANYLYDYGTSSLNWSTWDVSYWTSDTRLVLSSSAFPLADYQTAHVDVSTVADLHTLGFDGSKLFDGVKIL